jgi:hypothetical protein
VASAVASTASQAATVTSRASRPSDLVWRRFAHLVDQLGQVGVGLIEKRLAAQLRTNCLLEELQRWKAALLEFVVQVVGQVGLHPWHSSNYTYMSRSENGSYS